MATDVARISYDPARHYTSVANQQGRVTLEAEENEHRRILGDEERRQLREIVGVAGTPDDGYAVSAAGGFDLTIGAGTMYVGGNRVALDADIRYGDQPDWVDHAGHPEFAEPAPQDGEHVVLVVTEQDVTAVEDPMLLEVAIGGPDGAARTRLQQRVHRLPTRARDCPGALADTVAALASRGLVLDPATAELRSATRLLVDWESPPGEPDPCEPAAAGGYLGAENQVLRVQVAAVDQDTGAVSLLWGWDNASFLYRVTADQSTEPVLTLDRQPVDGHHRPRAGQAVELLRAASELHARDGTIEGHVAAHTGLAGVLATPYDPDTRTVAFPLAPPPEWLESDDTPQLFLRVWEGVVSAPDLGAPVDLPGTGLRLQLTTAGGLVPHVGDHWSIALRPATPTTVLPAVLLREPQPPDGPRSWLCPLAVVGWDGDAPQVLDDCRRPFDPLVDIDVEPGGGCCTVTIESGEDAGARLEAALEAAVAARPVADREHRITVCLRPGRHELDRPLVLEERHGHVHLEGCGEGAILAARRGAEEAFVQGLVVLVHADDVRISGLELELPLVPAIPGGFRPVHREVRSFEGMASAFPSLFVSIGLRPVHCAQLEVDRCLFRFRVGAGEGQGEADVPRNVFAVGIFCGSESWGLHVERCRFLYDVPEDDDLKDRRRGALRVLVGVLVAPTVTVAGQGTSIHGFGRRGIVRSLLDDAVLRDNRFAGLGVAVALFADLADVRLQDNTAVGCYGGFWLMSLEGNAMLDASRTYLVGATLTEAAAASAGRALADAGFEPMLLAVSVLGRTFPLPEHARVRGVEPSAGDAEADRWTEGFLAEVLGGYAEAEGEGEAHELDLRSAVRDAEGDDDPGGARMHSRALLAAHGGLSASERRAVLAGGTRSRLRLTCTGNDVDGPLERRVRTGMALLVWGGAALRDGEDEEVPSSAIVEANRFVGLAPTGQVVVIIRVAQVAVTGNVVANHDRIRGSFAALVPPQSLAVTGNVFDGLPFIPPRGLPVPFNTWLPFNAVRL